MSKTQKEKKNKKSNKKADVKSGKRRNRSEKSGGIITIIAGVLLGIILVFAIIAVDLISKMGLFSIVEEKVSLPEQFVDYIEPGEEEVIEMLEELRGNDDLSSVLKSWATNTSEASLMKDKNVINILLIGLDASEKNSDTIIIASINKSTKKIYLTSVYRDSYTYINASDINPNDPDKYAKINASYANGGAPKLIETLENNFKIRIDYYVSVNFESFSTIVDILGGITIAEVKQYEANAVGLGCPAGKNVTLNGEQALGFCRIRYCDADADVSRTRRQRSFISALVNETKDVSLDELTEIVKELVKYVKTDCKMADILTLATQAVTGKWYDFEIVSNAYPLEEHRGEYRGNQWVFIVDFPAAAQSLQNLVYGKTNIVLQEDRVSAVDIMNISQNTGNAAP